MQAISPVGRGAATKKYDLLTAMGAYALAQGKGDQRLVLRLITLLTARYNWQRDLLAVGQREIARLWSCDERTVKREMAKLRSRGWLVVHRQGARGRVTEYGVALESILSDTSEHWASVGPDFQDRLTGAPPQSNIVPLRPTTSPPPPQEQGHALWDAVRRYLHSQDPPLFAAWVEALSVRDHTANRLTLSAPSRFHAAYVQTHIKSRILAACARVDGAIAEIVIVH